MSKTRNFLQFLDFLAKNQKFCINETAQMLQVSPKTIQRYKKEIEEFFGVEFETIQKGCYYLPNIAHLKTLLIDKQDVEAMSRLMEILAMIEGQKIEQLNIDRDLLKLFDSGIYHLKEYPFEELKSPHIKKIKESIKRRRYADVLYMPEDEPIYMKRIKPHKIVFAEGNWYLVALTDDEMNNGFKFLRINFIKDFRLHKAQFHKDPEVLRFIKEFRTLFSAFKEFDFEVRVLVSPEVARHFRYKTFIKHQHILKEHEDGSLEIGYMINNEKEILHLAKRWLPHMKILQPVHLQRELEKMCRTFLGEES